MLLGLALLALAAAAEPIAIEPTLAVETAVAPPGPVSWSPNGKWLATRLDATSGGAVWAFADMAGSLPATLKMAAPPGADTSAGDVYTQWHSGDAAWGSGEVLVFSGAPSATATWTLWPQSPTGATPGPLLASFDGHLTTPTIPHDAAIAVAFVRSVGAESDIWVWARGSERAVPVTAAVDAERYPAFRADGGALAFVRQDHDNVYVVVADVRFEEDWNHNWRFQDETERPAVRAARDVGRPVWVGDTPVWYAEAPDGTWRIDRLKTDGTVAVVATGVRGGADAAPGVNGDWLVWVSSGGGLVAGTVAGDRLVPISLGLEDLSDATLGVRRDGDVWGAVSARHGDGRAVYVFDLTTVLARQVAQP